MVLFSRILIALGAFLIVVGTVYWLTVYEDEGFTLMITVAGGALLVGGYLTSVVRRARQSLTAGPGATPAGEEVEPHVAPTIWPLVFALSTIGLTIGAVTARWVLVPGAVLFVVAGVGWILDIRRQWGHAEGGDAAHHPQPGVKGPQTD